MQLAISGAELNDVDRSSIPVNMVQPPKAGGTSNRLYVPTLLFTGEGLSVELTPFHDSSS